MANDYLATYLNDHLAGAVAALDLLAYLQAANAGTPVGTFLTELRADVTRDRDELEALMGRLQVSVSRTRQATAWVAQKIAELKLRLDDPAGGPLRLLEGLDALAVGIEGKLALWEALAVAADDAPALQVADYEALAGRAEEQRCRLETVRLQAARTALVPDR
jgi:hypothetical protein